MERTRIGIVGGGDIAQHHLKVLTSLRDVEVVALASRGEERRHTTAEIFSIPHTYDTASAMLAHETLDAIFITVSADQIYAVAKECVSKGIPLFIEKPAGLTVQETEDLAQSSVPIMVGYNRRFYSNIQQAKKMIEECGPLLGVTVEAPERITQVRTLGKFTADMLDNWLVLNGTHGIDLLHYLGGTIADVASVAYAYTEKNGDNFGATIAFEEGAIGHYISHWNTPGKWRVTLYGDGIRADFDTLEQGTITTKEGTSPLPLSEEDVSFKPGFYAQTRYFIDRVQDKKPIQRPACSIEDAVETMRLAETIQTLP